MLHLVDMSTRYDSSPPVLHLHAHVVFIPLKPTSVTALDATFAPKPHTIIRSPRRQQTSMIWLHHKPSTDGTVLIDKDGDKIWSCLYCPKTYKCKSGTGKAIMHLEKSHNIDGSRTDQTQKYSGDLITASVEFGPTTKNDFQ